MKMVKCNLFISPISIITYDKKSTLRCRKYYYNGRCDFSFIGDHLPGSCSFSRDCGVSIWNFEVCVNEDG